MVAIAIKQFGGISPRTPARYLGDGQAQVALNCPAFSGSLQSLKDVGASLLTLPKTGVPKTIYRFGRDLASDTQYWFHWTTDVDVVKGPIAADTSERTFFTGDGGYPKVTDNSIALAGGTQYPMAAYRLGVPRPSSAPLATVSGTADVGAIPETRVYVWTWVNSWGWESEPSDPSIPVDMAAGQSVVLSALAPAPSGSWNLTKRRIYRSVSGAYLLVAEIGVAANSYTDDVPAASLGEELPSLMWNMPPDDLSGLVAGPNGIMAGFVGSDVYFCEPFRPFAFPEGYIQTVDYPVVGIGVMDTTFAVLTKGTPYFMQGSHPDSIAVVKSDIEQACVAKRSIVSFSGAVLYASPDGLVMLSPGGSKLITEMMFTREQWQSLNPSSMHAYQHDRKYVCFYDAGATKGGFIFDFTSGVFVMHDIYAECGYADLANDTLYLSFADKAVKKWQVGAAKSYTWKSKRFTLPRPASFACAQVEAEAYPLTAKFYADDALVHTEVVTSREPFRLPGGFMARDWEMQIEGDKEVFVLAIAQSMRELAGV